MTIPGGFIAGDVLGAADMNLLPAGKMGHAINSSDQTGITTIVDITDLTVTWTAVSARLYRVSLTVIVGTTSVDASWNVEVSITDESNTVIGSGFGLNRDANSDAGEHVISGAKLETGLSGSITRKLRIARNNTSSDSITVYGGGINASHILVEDIGPA